MAAFGSASLVLDGPNGGVKTDISGSTIRMGRTRENDVVVLDAAASSHHCEVLVEDGVLIIRDLNSSNGTFVNGRRVDTCPLFDGDILRIGQSQGRVTVIGDDGKPLRPVVSRAPIALVAVSVVVLIGAASAGLFLWARHHRQERDHFAEYESKAKVLLTGESPCDVASRMQLDFLEKHDAEIVHVDMGAKGHLTPDQRSKGEQVLTGSRQRGATSGDIVGRLSKLTADRQSKIEELKKFETQFDDTELTAAVVAVDKVFAHQQEIAGEFSKAWQDYGALVKQENDSLTGLLSAANDKTAKENSDKLTGLLGGVVHTPAQIHDTCEQSYRETRDKGVAQLASIAL